MTTVKMYCFLAFLALLNLNYAFDERIVGGNRAEDGQFPYQVSLQIDGEHKCGGSILDTDKPRWIVTAAHCVQNSYAKEWTVLTGTNKLSNGGRRYKVSKLIIHEDYRQFRLGPANDIALMKTSEAIDFNTKTKPISVNLNPISKGTILTLSGWGRLSYPGDRPNDLQAINITSITVEECQKLYKFGKIANNDICTLSPVGKGACNGDSGGPLALNGTLVGVVSGGEPCALGIPDIFTHVKNFNYWIYKNTGNFCW